MEDKKILLKQNIKFIVVHCSDTDKNYKTEDIHKLHLDFGWDGIGYHKIIEHSGHIENGRPEFWKGAHVYGFNDKSLGVCLIGRNEFSNDQFLSLEMLLGKWKTKYINATIQGHYESIDTKKTCPNFNVQNWCRDRGLV